MNNIKELTSELTKVLNTIKETEEKIKLKEEEYRLFYDSITKKDNLSLISEETMYKINKEREKKNFIMDNLKNKLEILEIKKLALKNNIQYSFIENNTSYIEEILNKYATKRIGEKTEAKIEKELQDVLLEKNNIDDIYLYLNIKEYNNGIYIRFEVNKSRFKVEYNILSSQKWFNDDRDMKIKLTNKYSYIDDINKYVDYIISEQKKIKAAKEELNKKIKEFNNNLKGEELYGTYNIRINY